MAAIETQNLVGFRIDYVLRSVGNLPKFGIEYFAGCIRYCAVLSVEYLPSVTAPIENVVVGIGYG